MWAKFKSFPLSVRAAIVFLSMVVLAGVIVFPSSMIPFLIIIGAIGAVLRLMIYFGHGV